MTEKNPFEQKIKQALDRQNINDDTRDALHRARLSALEGGSRPSAPTWKPVAAFASLVLIIGGILIIGINDDSGFPEADVEDLVVISSEDELEFFQELEFYVWLDEDQQV